MHRLLKTAIATALATALGALTLPAAGQGEARFPFKPIRLVTASAGSQTDIVTRMIGSKLMGFAPAPTTPEEQDRILRADIETFTRLAKQAGLRAQ